MVRGRMWLVIGLLVITTNSIRADDWPVPRGPSREPAPFRFDPGVLKSIPKHFLDDAQACVLYSGTTHLIEPDGTVEAISHEITHFNSRKGIEKLGEYRSISYDPSYEKLTLNEARVIKANGIIVPIEPKHVQLRDMATDFQVYDQDKQLVISFPNLEVGDSYEVKWTVRGKSPEFGGEFFARYSFGDDTNPVLRDEFRIRVPPNKTLRFATVNGKVDLKVSETAGEKLYSWSTVNRSELPRDEDRPSREELRLQVAVSTFPTWQAVAQWKQTLRAECWKCEPAVKKVLAEVTRDHKTDIEKAKALTYWVRRHIRYLSRGPNGLGYTPHLPHLVMSNLYGDCKDQAQLLAVMLHEIGLPVWLVTLGTLDDGQVLPEVPSPWGSHAIVLTRIDGREYWIDTTVSLAAWDFLPKADRNRQTYLTQEGNLTLARTPEFTYKDCRIEQDTHVDILPDGTTRSKRQITYHGSAAWSRREKWVDVPPGERRRTAMAELQDSHSKARLSSLKIDEKQLLDFDKSVRAEIEFEIPKHFSGESLREGSFTDSPVWTWLLGYNIDLERELPLQLTTPFESIHRYHVQVPLAYRAEALPEDRDVRSPWGFYKLRATSDSKDPRRIELFMHMRLEKTRVEKKDFARFLQFQEEVGRAYRAWLSLRPSSDLADAPQLEALVARQKPTDSQAVKVLAKLYLDHDQAADARRVLQKGAASFPNEKAIWELRVQAAESPVETEKLYRAMVTHFPGEAAYAVALGAVCVQRENFAQADQILSGLAKSGTASIRGAAHYQLAQSAYQQGNAAAAFKHLQQALINDPVSLASIEAMQFKARVCENLGRLQEGIQTLLTAVEADPTVRGPLEYLVRLEWKAGLRDAALDHLRRYTVAAEKDMASLAIAAELHLQLGRYEDAHDLANRARTGGPQEKTQRVLGLVHLHRREYALAATALAQCKLEEAVLAGRLQALLHLGDLDEAQKGAGLASSLKSPKLDALRQDINALSARRDKILAQGKLPADPRAAATRVINRFLCAEQGLSERWPFDELESLIQVRAEEEKFSPLLALRGWLALEKGQMRQALADADAALKLSPAEARAYLVRGRIRVEQGNFDAALTDLRKAADLSQGRDPLVLHWLAAALSDAGRAKEAVETQRLATLLRPNDRELLTQLQRMENSNNLRGQD